MPSSAVTSTVMVLEPVARFSVPSASVVPPSLMTLAASESTVVAVTVVCLTLAGTVAV